MSDPTNPQSAKTEVISSQVAGPPSGESSQTLDLSPRTSDTAAISPGPARDFTSPSADSGATADFTLRPSAGSEATGDFTPLVPGGSGAAANSARSAADKSIAGQTTTVDPLTGRVIPHVSGYEILGELGRGGMGVVYKARQKALNRLVAIKMVLAGGHAGPEQIARFHIEAQAVAALQHPNIVQIYEVGECESLPYFTLEFVDGGALDKALAGKPQSPKDSAHLMETLSRAMYFAHQHGIVHRDLKPANVLLSADGEPKITDFGLAKKLEGDSSQTKSGTLMGTPSYMAPEQARGEFKELGPPADVHALGAILYEMLVGRPPFLGASAVETIMQVITEEPVPPSRLLPKLPRDIETICLKCLQKEPEKRYATAELLADDLRRFLDGEPILSRPVSAPERLWRWCRRNPRIAALVATVAGLLIVVAVTSTFSAVTIARERNQKELERKAADEARVAAESAEKLALDRKAEADEARMAAENAKQLAEDRKEQAEAAQKEADANAKVATDQAGLALSTMQILIDKVQNQLEDAPRTQKLKRELLETAMAGLKEVAKKAEGSTSVEATMLAAHMRMGNMFRQLGATEEAMNEFSRCHEIAKRRAAAKPNNDAAQGNLAAVLTVLGDMDQELRRDMVAALDCYQRALDIREKLHGKPPSTEGPLSPESVKQALAEAHTRVAVTVLRLGDPPKSLPSFEKALVLRRELSEAHPEVESLQQDLARSYNAVGEVCFLSGNTEDARKYYDQCLELRDAMLKAKPESVRFKLELANTCGNYGDLCLRSRDNQAAQTHYDRAYALSQELADLDDQNIDYQRGLGMALYRLGALAQRSSDDDSARKHFGRCLELREKLAGNDPKNEVRQMELMLALAHCGEHQRAAQIAEAVRTGKKDRELLFEVTRCYAQCAAAAAPADKQQADAYIDQAIDALGEAVTEGYSDVVAFQTEPDLDPIRGHAGYEALSAKLGKR